jgi:hypothetical protein
MASVVKYQKWILNQLNGANVIDWDTDTIKLMLTTSTYTPNASTHDFKDDITNEVTGTNYVAGGTALASKSVTESAGVVTVDAADITWSQHASGFSNARYAVLYKDTGVAATSLVVGYIDFTSDKGNVSGDLTVQFNAAGIFTSS